jgi:MFS transporter, OFA family, oxalate/formate antiporter
MNPKIILAIGSTISLSGIFLSSFATSFPVFIVLYGVMSGIGCGINYMIPMVIGWKWYPNNKGWVTGVVISAYGFSSFLFTNLSTLIINPHGKDATNVITKDLSYFTKDVSDRVPLMI